MKLSPWNKEDSKEMVWTAKRVVEMIIGGSFAGLVVSPLSISPEIIFGLLLAVCSSFLLVYFSRRM